MASKYAVEETERTINLVWPRYTFLPSYLHLPLLGDHYLIGVCIHVNCLSAQRGWGEHSFGEKNLNY